MSSAPPLAGIRVVEVATYLAAPWSAMMLGDLGADVVKVEPPGGESFRRLGRPSTPIASLWASCNRGKRSVALDLKSDSGLAELLELLADADILVCNLRPNAAERLGFGDASLAERNPALIRCWVTGVGSTGQLAQEPAFDGVIQALSGLTEAVSPTGEPALTAGYPVDKLTSLMATQSILAALFARERSGLGDRIELAMLDAAAYVNFPDLFAGRVFVEHQPDAARRPEMSRPRPLPASDGSFVLASVSGAQIKRACAAVGRPEWVGEMLGQPDADATLSRMQELFPPVTRRHSLAHWLETFRAHDVPVAACLSIDQHLADPQVRNNDIYQLETWPSVGLTRTVRYPALSARWGVLRGQGAPTIEL
jgi:CoA:oxalate CoA-transferase